MEPSGIEDLADDPGRIEAGQPGEIDAGLGLAHPLKHAAGPGAKRKDVPRAAEVGGNRRGVDGHVDGGGAVAGRDAGGHPESALGVDADGEGGGQLLGVALGHLGQAELVATLAGQSQADQPAPVQGHEVDHLGRRKLRGTDEIALVLAILVIGHDDDLAVAQIVDRLLDGPESGHGSQKCWTAMCHTADRLTPQSLSAFNAATYFPMVSASR